MTNCIIIPVRSGSKGLQDKNIREFCRVPLLGYVLQKLSSSGIFEYIIVSSDSQNYLDIARKYGATNLINRPTELATDTATTYQVVEHAIQVFENKVNLDVGRYFLTQVTSPLWSQSDLTDFVYRAYAAKSSIVSVCLSKQNPHYNLLEKSEKGYSLVEPSEFNRRQDHPEVYFINGCFYSFTKSSFLLKQVIREPDCDIYVMDALRSIDIDDSSDFTLCELLAQNMEKF